MAHTRYMSGRARAHTHTYNERERETERQVCSTYAFQPQHWFRERAVMLRYSTLPVLFSFDALQYFFTLSESVE